MSSAAAPHAYARVFTDAQLQAYYNHINLPAKYRSASHPRDLALLTALHKHQIAAVPYENLSLHYSSHKTVSLDPQTLFAKIVSSSSSSNHRGGYCMEGSLFFLHILRSIGFAAYPTLVRMRLRQDGVPSGDYIGITHIMLIISLGASDDNEEKYACDVSFGGDGPLRPLPLCAGVAVRNLGTQEVRLAWERIPNSGSKFWVYQYRNGGEQDEWKSYYAFSDVECMEADFCAINYWTSQGPTFQKTVMFVVKFLLGAGAKDGQEDVDVEEEAVIVGKLMLVNDTLKRNMGGRTEVVQVFATEAERVEALRTWFGILLTEEEINGIATSATAIKKGP